MANLNKVFLIGNLTRDPEVRYTSGGAAVANFSMAINERYRTAAGVDKEETCFVELEVWGKQAETLKQYVRKGDPLFVEGRLRMDTWQDKTTGQNRSRMRVRCDRFQFLTRGNAGQGGGNFGGQQQYGQPQAPQGGGYQQQAAPQQAQQFQQPQAPSFNSNAGAQMPPPPSFGGATQSAPAAPASTMPAAPTFQPIDEPEDDIPF